MIKDGTVFCEKTVPFLLVSSKFFRVLHTQAKVSLSLMN